LYREQLFQNNLRGGVVLVYLSSPVRSNLDLAQLLFEEDPRPGTIAGLRDHEDDCLALGMFEETSPSEVNAYTA
jgi:hypothetical protein